MPEGSEEMADVEKACLSCENRANIHSHTRAPGSLTDEKTFAVAEEDRLDLWFLTREIFNDGFIMRTVIITVRVHRGKKLVKAFLKIFF